MIIEIKAPSPGESITEVEIATWFVNDGDIVSKDQEIAEIESDKATLPLISESAGQIKILKQVGEAIPVGTVLCTIDSSKAGKDNIGKEAVKEETPDKSVNNTSEETEAAEEKKVIQASTEEDEKEPSENPVNQQEKTKVSSENLDRVKVTPVAKKMMEEYKLSLEDVISGLRKIGSEDIKQIKDIVTNDPLINQSELTRDESRTRVSSLRRKLSARLVAVKNETAMLTTFNELDMSRVMAIRKNHQDKFVKQHGIKLGFMSFFVKASAIALKMFPQLNSRLEGEELITPEYCDIGIAVQSDKGLMVPILRNAEIMSLAQIEKEIASLAEKARSNRISIEDMSGGTFTITNGGVFGSMMSTPILNPPQAAILGMHNIIERPVAENGQVVIRPMMYLALSYDHRIIDGKDSVSFLVKLISLLENPEMMLFSGEDPEGILLGI
jgi:2-oxoglutarate dehydrogenase E2 component (dihydrolipoamide succinyltransferase)